MTALGTSPADKPDGAQRQTCADSDSRQHDGGARLDPNEQPEALQFPSGLLELKSNTRVARGRRATMPLHSWARRVDRQSIDVNGLVEQAARVTVVIEARFA